ncbi:putative G-patch domain protein [Xylariomycetidae sp. FL2044]|nr:putative G-patch domain protein [Xylariomycetidae sp. FL2044]
MASDEEDDYLNMTFTDEPPPKSETSLQRRQRLKREGEIKGRTKSKAELAAEEREAREAALSKSMLQDAQAKKSKGFAMMSKMGFKGGALGSANNPDARAEPIRPEMKDDRGGIGLDSERKRKLNEAADQQEKKVKLDENEFRDRVRRERELARWERQVHGAMKVCERMDEEAAQERMDDGEVGVSQDDGGEAEYGTQKKKKRTLSTRLLKSIPVVWRGLVRKREEAERDRRMRYDLEQSSDATRLPTYADDLEDEDDRKAVGKGAKTAYVQAEDLEEEDPELDEFSALEPDERLQRLVEFLRKEYLYCFWCKCAYLDESMEGCPGVTEEDHD